MCFFDYRLGEVNSARKHLCFLGKASDHMELKKLEAVEKHTSKCGNARKLGDWKTVLMEVDAAIVSGADFSPHVRLFNQDSNYFSFFFLTVLNLLLYSLVCVK